MSKTEKLLNELKNVLTELEELLKEDETNNSLAGKTIKEANIDGYGVYIKFTDGVELDYSASEGGYSTWDIY